MAAHTVFGRPGALSVSVVLIAVALGTDAFSVAVAVGPRARDGRAYFRLVWHFAWFQFMMTFGGALAGEGASQWLTSVGRYVACAILAGVAAHMFVSALKGEERRAGEGDPTIGWSLAALALATSLDALAVGGGYGLVTKVEVLLPSVVIGVVAGVMTLGGLLLGRQIAGRIGSKAEFLGAAILAGLAIRQLF